MKTENVLYTDGHDVTVTDSVLQVRKKWYSLNEISRHGFAIIQPVRFPKILLLIAGLLLTVTGAAKLIAVSETVLAGLPININELAMGMGLFCILVGSAMISSMSERYAVSITTAKGEKNVIVSKHKEYITQIVHALNEAFFARIHGTTEKSTKREFTVSGR